jgi:hypothetical protein
MLLTRIVYATVTGRIDCDENPDHEYCKGDKGKNGVPFCDLDYQELGFTVCRDRDVNPDVDCDVKSDDLDCIKHNKCSSKSNIFHGKSCWI